LQGSHFRKLRDIIMGRVRCVKPKADGDGVVNTKTAKKKVARKKSKVGSIKGHTKVLAQ
jgi:hypothetical protein